MNALDGLLVPRRHQASRLLLRSRLLNVGWQAAVYLDPVLLQRERQARTRPRAFHATPPGTSQAAPRASTRSGSSRHATCSGPSPDETYPNPPAADTAHRHPAASAPHRSPASRGCHDVARESPPPWPQRQPRREPWTQSGPHRCRAQLSSRRGRATTLSGSLKCNPIPRQASGGPAGVGSASPDDCNKPPGRTERRVADPKPLPLAALPRAAHRRARRRRPASAEQEHASRRRKEHHITELDF